ncbi:MAG: DUF3108 domain-containing protein [Pseudoxanthomonas sp.]
MNMKTRLPTFAAFATAALLALVPSAHAIEAFTANYQANALGMLGEGQMTLAPQSGNRWQYSMSVRNSLVDLSQQTVFDVQGEWLRPLSSSDVSRMLVKRKAVNTSYDWSKRQARWSGDVKPERAGPAALKDGDMDALLLNLAVVKDVAAGKSPTYRMVENGEAKTMTYQVAGKEKIEVAGKTFEATKAVRDTGKRQIIVWVVPSMPAPARILQRENGQDTIDLKITSWKQ